MIWRLLLGLLVSLSFLAGYLLYSWAREEVDKNYKHLSLLGELILVIGFAAFASLLNPWYLILLATAYGFAVLNTKQLRTSKCLDMALLGAAFAFFAEVGIASLVFIGYGIVLGSYAFKKVKLALAGKLALVFLASFAIVSLVPFPEIVSLHAGFWLLAISIACINKNKKTEFF